MSDGTRKQGIMIQGKVVMIAPPSPSEKTRTGPGEECELGQPLGDRRRRIVHHVQDPGGRALEGRHSGGGGIGDVE